MIKLNIKYGNSQTDLRFPCTEKEMNAALERIHAEDVTPLELYVAEVIFPKELDCLQDRFVNLDEVNFLGKRMDGFFGDEEYQFYEAMKELVHSGKGIFTEHGLLFVDENTPFQKVYDGQVFPAYVYDQMICFIRAEYNGKTEYLYLPCEEEAIDKAFSRLGAPTPDDVELSWEDYCIENEKWAERFKEIAAEEGAYELNKLAAAVNSADMDMEKLWAVAEYAEAEDAEQLARLAKNIDCFTVAEGAADYDDVGRYVVDHTEQYAMPPELENYFDFGAFGKHIAEEYYGKFVGGNFIYNDTDTSLLDILYQDEPMTMGGM